VADRREQRPRAERLDAARPRPHSAPLGALVRAGDDVDQQLQPAGVHQRVRVGLGRAQCRGALRRACARRCGRRGGRRRDSLRAAAAAAAAAAAHAAAAAAAAEGAEPRLLRCRGSGALVRGRPRRGGRDERAHKQQDAVPQLPRRRRVHEREQVADALERPDRVGVCAVGGCHRLDAQLPHARGARLAAACGAAAGRPASSNAGRSGRVGRRGVGAAEEAVVGRREELARRDELVDGGSVAALQQQAHVDAADGQVGRERGVVDAELLPRLGV
jgi:hypothetical protein